MNGTFPFCPPLQRETKGNPSVYRPIFHEEKRNVA